MAQHGFSLLPTLARCDHCGKPIRYGTEAQRFHGDRFTFHEGCVEPARALAIQKGRRTLKEEDLLPSERRDILRGLQDLEKGTPKEKHMKSDRSTHTTQTVYRRMLQQMARRQQLLIDCTPDGIVNAGNTATVWGEGDNVDGFRWALRGEVEQAIPMDAYATDQLFGEGFYALVDEWASSQPED